MLAAAGFVVVAVVVIISVVIVCWYQSAKHPPTEIDSIYICGGFGTSLV